MYHDPLKSVDKLRIGDRIPYFSLRGTDGKIHTVSDYASASALVVVFYSNICPYCRVYDERLVAIANEFQPQRVRFIAVCSNDSDDYPEESFQRMIIRSEEIEAPFPFLHDESQIVATAFGANATPEVFLFDSNSKLVYHGAIDDSPDSPEDVVTPYLKNAIAATLGGAHIEETETQPFGCSIKWDI
jgi:peroxiredoxin